jgi:hypothetical protein
VAPLPGAMSTRAPRKSKSHHSKSKSLFDKTQPLTVGADGDDFDDLEYADGGAASEDAPLDGYQESACETTTVRCCGSFCMILTGILLLSWIVHAIPVATVSDIPPFARSMIWMSIAHHTDAWRDAQGLISPPPPAFGDGLGNFPDVFPPPPPAGR